MANEDFAEPGAPRVTSWSALSTPYGPSWAHYVLTAISVLALTAVLAILRAFFPESQLRVPYVLLIIPIAYYFGTGPAVLAFALGLLSFIYLYVPHPGALFSATATPDRWIALVGVNAGMLAAGLVSILLRRVVLHAEQVRADLVESNEALRSEIGVRERAEQALERSESRFRTTFEKAGIGMTVVDMRGYVQAANPAFAELTGYTLDELPGMHVQDYAYPEDLPHGNELLFEMIEGKRDSYTVEKRYVKKDGSIIWGRLTASIARNPEPEPPFIIGMIEDVTDRKLAAQRECEVEEAKLEFYRRTITAATNGKLVIADAAEIRKLSPTALAQWEVKTAADLPRVRDEIRGFASALGVDEERAWEFSTCVGEAMTNAIKHAGGGTASIRSVADGMLFVMADTGPGIGPLMIPDVALRSSYSTAGTLGMGYKVIIGFADRVYLATGPGGTTVAIEMKLKPPEPDDYLDAMGLLNSSPRGY